MKDLGTRSTKQLAQLMPANDYVLALINMTDVVLTKQRVRMNGGTWTQFIAMAAIGKTCQSNDPQTCFDQKAYVPIMVIQCGGSSFDIELRSNNDTGAIWENINASCNDAGGVITLMP